jgi:hypothetical protein
MQAVTVGSFTALLISYDPFGLVVMYAAHTNLFRVVAKSGRAFDPNAEPDGSEIIPCHLDHPARPRPGQ